MQQNLYTVSQKNDPTLKRYTWNYMDWFWYLASKF